MALLVALLGHFYISIDDRRAAAPQRPADASEIALLDKQIEEILVLERAEGSGMIARMEIIETPAAQPAGDRHAVR